MIRYYIPADGDDAQHPNIFHLPPSGQSQQRAPTLRDVRQHFPLPGAYHFRFKTRLDAGKGGPVVWMDVTEDGAEVPSFDNGVVLAKVTRLSAAAPPATAAGNQHGNSSSNAGVAASASAARAPPASSKGGGDDDLLSMGGGGGGPRGGSGRVGASPAQPQTAAAATSKPIYAAPEADPFGLFADSGGAGSSSAAARPQQQQQPQQPQAASAGAAGGGGGVRGAGADLLNFDAFGSAAAPPSMTPMGQAGPRPGGMMMGGGRMSPQPPMQGPGAMGGMGGMGMGAPPRGGMPRPSYSPGGNGGWM